MIETPKEQPLFIPGPNGRLEARIAGISPENSKIGIVCHPHPLYQGSQDNKVVTTLVRAWQALGLATIRFNFRGVGKSEGEYGEGIGEIEDLKAVIQWVQETLQIPLDLWLGGFSFGACIAAHEANDSPSPVAGLLTVAPPVERMDFSHLNPLCPWIIIQGDMDELTPLSAVASWHQKLTETQSQALEPYPRQLIVIEGASHFFHGRLVQLKKDIEHSMKPFLIER